MTTHGQRIAAIEEQFDADAGLTATERKLAQAQAQVDRLLDVNASLRVENARLFAALSTAIEQLAVKTYSKSQTARP